MKNSLKKHKKVLGLHHERENLSKVEKEIVSAYPKILFYKADTYNEGLQLLLSLTFDLVVAEKNIEMGKSLIDLAISRNIPVILLSGNGSEAESFKNVDGFETEATLSGGNLERLVPAMEKALNSKHKFNVGSIFEKLSAFFSLAVHKLSPRGIPRDYQDPSAPVIYY